MQNRPVCFGCPETVEHDPIFEAPCGHDRCASVVWHGLCLFTWRERREEDLRRFGDAILIVFDRRAR